MFWSDDWFWSVWSKSDWSLVPPRPRRSWALIAGLTWVTGAMLLLDCAVRLDWPCGLFPA